MPRVPLWVKIAVPVLGLLLTLGVIVTLAGVLQSWWALPFGPVRVRATQPIQFPHDVHTALPRTVVQQEALQDPHTQIALEDALRINSEAQLGDVVGAGIDCLFCHRTALESEAASLPAVQQCYFCHQVIKQDSPEVAKILYAWENNQPLNWIRVHRLPDHVQFVHDAHVRFFSERNNISPSRTCAICHGEVATMKVAEQVRNLKMRDCVDCHRGGYLTNLTEDARMEELEALLRGETTGPPTDCAACHY